MTRFELSLAVAASILAGCDGGEAPAPPAKTPERTPARPELAPPVFEERAEAAGLRFKMAFIPSEQGEHFKINLYDHGAGVAVGDYDGDGYEDVYFCNQLGGNALFHNNGDGKFTDLTASSGADLALADRICVAASFADYDGDGRQDLFVTSTRGGNALFHNEGGGKFADVTAKAGVTLVAHSQTGTFFDADGDGDLDLFVANTAKWTNDQFDPERKYYVGPESLFEFKERPPERNAFFRNKGDGTFEDATEESGLAGQGWNCECAVFDYDGDGVVDLFVSSMFGKSALYRNDGRGHFVDKTSTVLGRTSYGALGAHAFDYDGDGRLDLFVADMHSDMWSPIDLDLKLVEETRKYKMPFGPMVDLGLMTPKAADELRLSVRRDAAQTIFGNCLFHNLGGGQFEEVSDKAGVETFQPWGVVPGDFRNAGVEDVFIPSGMGYPFFYWPNRYLLNRGDGTFAERSREAGFDPPPGGIVLDDYGGKKAVRSSRSAAVADFDGDGRLDLVVNNFNERAYLYANRSPQRPWIAFRLRGTKSNRDAIGALVTIVAGGRTQVRQVDAAGGYLSQSSKTVHFGLGDAQTVDRCEIRWPSRTVQQVTDLAIGAVHDVVEPKDK